MKTSAKTILSAFAKQYRYPKMYRAIKAQTGLEGEDFMNLLCEVSEHSAAAGFNGFIYYSDTTAFYKKHKKEIQKMLSDSAEDFGESVVQIVKSFERFKNDPEYSALVLEREIFGRTTDTMVMNYLSWFALEQVAFEFANFKYEYEQEH